MKGLVNVLELLLTGVILILAFIHFFPQYSITTGWSSVLLDTYVVDTLNTIDRLDKTYDYAIASGDPNEFEQFMNKTFSPYYTGQSFIWWKEVDNLPGGQDTSRKPYFTEAKREAIVDVVDIGGTFYVYSLSLGLGYPY